MTQLQPGYDVGEYTHVCLELLPHVGINRSLDVML